MRPLRLRTRITFFVTAAFAVVMVVIAWFVVERIEDDLVSDTRSSAESVLSEYLESIHGGAATVGVVGGQQGTRFFYRDSDGGALTEAQYFELLTAGLDQEFRALIESNPNRIPGFLDGQQVPMPGAAVVDLGTAIVVEPETGQLLDASGSAINFIQGPIATGDPRPVDLGPDVVAVSQTLRFPDSTEFEVGVSSPLRPVTDSLDALRRLVWFAVPALVLAVAGITWLTSTRALAPVHAVSSRARAISAHNLSDRLPTPDVADEIGELVGTLNDMLARLERSQDRQRQLVSDISHELRSPVAASRAQLEVAAALPTESDWGATAATVLAEQEHLSALIDDLLALSRLDETGMAESRDVDIEAVVSAEVRRPRSPHPHLTVELPPHTIVRGDPRLLARAFRNLLDNAARHAVERVDVSVHRSGSTVSVHIDDDGPGVAEHEREHIFERFVRLDEARDRDSGGTGLGLAIAREVALAHGGDAVCATSPHGGARLTVSLPIH